MEAREQIYLENDIAAPNRADDEQDSGGRSRSYQHKLSDDILVGILSLLQYNEAVRTASVSRRWERLVTLLRNLTFSMPPRHGWWHTGTHTAVVQTLQLVCRKDVPMECRDCRHADDFMALANARRPLLDVQCAMGLPDEDASAWSFDLPSATTELHLQPYWYAVQPPRLHGASLRTLWG